jgi:hypothetical protein
MASKKIVSIELKGARTLQRNLERIIKDAVVNSAQQSVSESARDLAFVAEELAPRKSGALEEAIKPITPKRASGFMAQAHVEVDPSVYSEENKKSVGEYAVDAHENIRPVGNKKLGRRSQEKNQAISGRYDGLGVGGGFMRRALGFLSSRIVEDLEKSLKNALSRYH